MGIFEYLFGIKLKEPVLKDINKILERTQENFNEAEANAKSNMARQEQQMRTSSEEALAELMGQKVRILRQLKTALRLKSDQIGAEASGIEREYKNIR
jgi:predicted Zn-dependent peptidase